MQKYECGYCGRKFETIKARNLCESNCIKVETKRDEELERNELEIQRKKDREEINNLISRYVKLVSEVRTTVTKYNEKYRNIDRENSVLPKSVFGIF